MFSGLTDGMDSFINWFSHVLKQNVADYSTLETAQNEYSLVTNDGSLLSVIRIDGYKSLINISSFYEKIASPFTEGIEPFFVKEGHSLQVWFSVDPRKSEKIVTEALSPSYETIKNLDLDLKELLDERVKNISSRTNYEECYFVLWTRPSILVNSEAKKEMKRKLKVIVEQRAPVKNSQDPFAANWLIENQHMAYVNSVEDLLLSVGISAEKLDVHSAVREIRKSVDENGTAQNWKPFLPGDRIAPSIRVEKYKKEEWDIVWPKINWQIYQKDAKIVNDKLVEIGDTVYAPIYVDLLPKNIQPFSNLYADLGGKFPWRISFMIEGGGLAAVATRGLFASILGFFSGENKLLNKGVKVLKEMNAEYNQTIAKIRISLCTWGSKDDVSKVERQLSELARTVESWGSSLVSEVTGDPVAGFMSNTLAATDSIATISAAPLGVIPFMMPLSRPTSGWKRGSVLFLSPDMKLIPYQPGSSEQTTWITLIFALPGSGKSVLMNVTNLALCLAPGITRLPKIGIVDIGPSSSGLISLLKESLPVEKRHLVQYYRLRMTEDYCINPFDTQLGCRFPTAAEKAFLNNFLLLLVTDTNKESPEVGMSGLVQAVIEDMYYKCSEKGRPKLYAVGVDKRVDEAIKKNNLKIDERTTWWEIVDMLFEQNSCHEAMLAQRYAVPILTEATISAQDEKIRETYSKIIVETEENLVENFNRSVTDAVIQYKILSRPTVFDIGEARVVSIDLDEVAKSGGSQADRQTSIMYMLSRYILGKDFKLDMESLNEMPYPSVLEIPISIPSKKYKEYHKKRIEDAKEDYKRLCYDEFHRTSKSKMVREQVILDMREGRKWNIDVTLSSQSISDFDETMKSFATAIFIMDAGNERDVKELINTFGMEDPSEQFYLSKGRVHGPRNGRPGVFMAKFATNKGRYTQLLSAYIGAMEMWALNTTAEDVSVRTKMYEKVGPAKARFLLAKYYPNGIKKVVEQRKENMKLSNIYNEDDSNIYVQIVEEILNQEGIKRI